MMNQIKICSIVSSGVLALRMDAKSDAEFEARHRGEQLALASKHRAEINEHFDDLYNCATNHVSHSDLIAVDKDADEVMRLAAEEFDWQMTALCSATQHKILEGEAERFKAEVEARLDSDAQWREILIKQQIQSATIQIERSHAQLDRVSKLLKLEMEAQMKQEKMQKEAVLDYAQEKLQRGMLKIARINRQREEIERELVDVLRVYNEEVAHSEEHNVRSRASRDRIANLRAQIDELSPQIEAQEAANARAEGKIEMQNLEIAQLQQRYNAKFEAQMEQYRQDRGKHNQVVREQARREREFNANLAQQNV